MGRGAAAKIGGMDRQTLRDWVHRFNASGLDGLLDNWTEGPKPRLSSAQMAEVAAPFDDTEFRELASKRVRNRRFVILAGFTLIRQ
jgi:transposase